MPESSSFDLMFTYLMSSVLKLTILGINVVLLTRMRISFQSVLGVPNNKHTDSNANRMALGGLPSLLNSSKLSFLIDFTAALASNSAGSTYKIDKRN